MIILSGLPPENEMELFGEECRWAAIKNPSATPDDALIRELFRFIGTRYSVGLALEHFQTVLPDGTKMPPPPVWHCSVETLHDIESGNDASFGKTEQAILVPELWDMTDVKDAREIMGYLLGPVIVQKTQPIIERRGLFAFHWYTPADRRYERKIYERGRGSESRGED